METKVIDRQKTLDAIRAKYGSVLEFCRQVQVNPVLFYMVTAGQRGRGGDKKRGPNPTKSLMVLKRLEAEGLLIVSLDDVSNG